MEGREANVMDATESKALAALPDEIEVWRGVGCRAAVEGMSWTVDRDRGVWFARRFAAMEGRRAILVRGTVPRNAVLAHLRGRGESEIVADPDDVAVVEVAELPS